MNSYQIHRTATYKNECLAQGNMRLKLDNLTLEDVDKSWTVVEMIVKLGHHKGRAS